jgi:hypothetical protein
VSCNADSISSRMASDTPLARLRFISGRRLQDDFQVVDVEEVSRIAHHTRRSHAKRLLRLLPQLWLLRYVTTGNALGRLGELAGEAFLDFDELCFDGNKRICNDGIEMSALAIDDNRAGGQMRERALIDAL